jgi:hypothetical protein
LKIAIILVFRWPFCMVIGYCLWTMLLQDINSNSHKNDHHAFVSIETLIHIGNELNRIEPYQHPDEARELKSWITHHCKLHPICEKHVCLRSMLAICFLGLMLNLLYLRSTVRGCLIARLFCKFCKWFLKKNCYILSPIIRSKGLICSSFPPFPLHPFLTGVDSISI